MKGSRVGKVLIAVLMLVLMIGDTAALVYWAKGSWDARVSIVLQIIALYGIGLGFVTKSGLLRNFADLPEDMTSPNLFRFVAGNLRFLAILTFISRVGSGPRRSSGSSLAVGCISNLLILLVFPLELLYYLFHLIAIIPIGYLGFLIVSALVESVIGSAADVEITEVSTEQKLSIKEIVASDPVVAKSLLIGIPAAVLALVTRVVGVFLGN